MGDYSKIVAKLTLKDDVPKPVATMLRLLVCDKTNDWLGIRHPGLQHPSFGKPFFQAEKWYSLFGDFTHHEGQCHKTWIEPHTIDVIASIKNYDAEVQKFWEWIQEYVDRSKPYEVSKISNEIPMDDQPVLHTFLESSESSAEQDALHKYICCDCGTHLRNMWSDCCVCGGQRISLTSVVINIAGMNYMESFSSGE